MVLRMLEGARGGDIEGANQVRSVGSGPTAMDTAGTIASARNGQCDRGPPHWH